MFSIFQQKNRKTFDVRSTIARLVELYYDYRADSKMWQSFSLRAAKMELSIEKREETLKEEHERTIREIVAKSKSNPGEIRKRIEREFGFKYVE